MVLAPLSSQSREEVLSTGCNGNGAGRCNGNCAGRCNGNRGDAHNTAHNGDNGKSGTEYGDGNGGGNDFNTGFDDQESSYKLSKNQYPPDEWSKL